MMRHKGYIGVLKVDTDAGLLRGRVINTRDLITFQGRTVEEARREFVESVEDYLEFCAARGEEPEKPFFGQFPSAPNRRSIEPWPPKPPAGA